MFRMETTYKEGIRGISLIETSFFVVVLGLMLTATSPLYNLYHTNKKTSTTSSNVEMVQQALNNFYLTNGYLPCPAGRNIPVDGANFGRARTNCSAIGGAVAGDGTVSTPGRTVGGANSSIRIGAVPVRDLGLPDSAMADARGHLFVYAVSESYAIPSAKVGDTVHGAISIVDSNSNPVTTLPGIAVYVVTAANADGAGAWTLSGKKKANCPASGESAENCNDDGTFLSKVSSNVLAFKADTCSPQQKKQVGNIGNISFLLDSSGSMETKDIKPSGGGNTKISRLDASVNSLNAVIPAIAQKKAESDPNNLLGFATFSTYCEGMSGSTLKKCKEAPGSCYGLSGVASSKCMFNQFSSNTVADTITNPGATPITGSEYLAAADAIVTSVNNLPKTTGGTPLYDTVLKMADAMQDGQPNKPNVLVVVSDGADSNSFNTNYDMIDTISEKYPNMQIDFVFVGSSPDPVKKKLFNKTPKGHVLKGKFIAVQDTQGITDALLSTTSPCPQP